VRTDDGATLRRDDLEGASALLDAVAQGREAVAGRAVSPEAAVVRLRRLPQQAWRERRARAGSPQAPMRLLRGHMLLVRQLRHLVLFAVGLVACAGSSRPPATMAPRTKDPCVTWVPESFCAGWSSTEDRRCTSNDDCVVAIVKFDSVTCPFGLFGGFAEAVSSRAAEPRVRARLAAVSPCSLRDHLQVGRMCGAPPIECVGGLCGYADKPPTTGF